MEQNLADIIHGCKHDKRDAQHALYKLYYGYAMSISIRYVQEENEAISIVNDAFLKAYRRIGKFDIQQEFKPWFRRIVINTAIDYFNLKNKEIMQSEIGETQIKDETGDVLSQIAYKELLAMIQSLSEVYRTVFNLYVIDGFKHEEIAEKLNISVGTSKSNLFKARAVLQKKIQSQLFPDHA